MSRRPTCDEVETQLVTIQESVPNSVTVSVNSVSNLLSDENVVAFAPGIVIDDGTSSAVSSENPSEIQKLNESSVPMFTRDELVNDAVQRCMQRHETR